ncbi:MAG: serine/threonine protein kinase, partial [Planctomycetes bacterium]|nr:serine/threonine protein kinase [Planctomycetota bacterium]
MATSGSEKTTDSKPADQPADALGETNITDATGDLSETVVTDPTSQKPAETLAKTEVADVNDKSKSDAPAGEGTATGKSAAKKSSGKSSAKKAVTQLGDFKLLKKLGQGGMGTVYLARQLSLDRHVALKTLSKELAKKELFVQRFLRESRSMAKLQHPNIVQVYAADSASGFHFAAIEYIDGQSMQDWMNSLKSLSVGDAVHVILVCADALKHAHDQNMIHRDIKPDNILVTKKGVVKVADFGLAKALDEDVSMTQSGTGLGTPLYMAPEQARNAKHVDQRSDIYALGCTLYYFITGELPFKGTNTLELIMAKEEGRFKPARRIKPEVPEQLDLMIDKMMAKEAKHRYADCGEIIRDLQRLQLENPSLSFIDSEEKAVIARGISSAPSTVSTKPTPSPASITSAQDAAKRKKPPTKADRREWFVHFTPPGGKSQIVKMTTQQIVAGLKSGMLDTKSKAKASKDGQMKSLKKYPQFARVAEDRVYKAKDDAKTDQMRSLYDQVEKYESGRKFRRWIKRLKDSA